MKERTLVLVKPDGVQRGLAGEIISRFERKGLKIVGLKLVQVTEELAAKHYEAHREKPFYPPLVEFITSSPVVALALEGDNAIAVVRALMGPTNPADAPAGTIRGDFGLAVTMNLVHGSDSPEAAARELALFFAPEELLDYTLDTGRWTGGE